jgi:hypothetical protein
MVYGVKLTHSDEPSDPECNSRIAKSYVSDAGKRRIPGGFSSILLKVGLLLLKTKDNDAEYRYGFIGGKSGRDGRV